MNKRKGFADEVAKQAKQGLQPVLKADNGSQPDSQRKRCISVVISHQKFTEN